MIYILFTRKVIHEPKDYIALQIHVDNVRNNNSCGDSARATLNIAH